ncbi:MAG TPA: hypothetical protein VJR47_11615 [Stellaceae bacterium]|nr:hypothetical protein [Stellaceae bacterium]
MNPFPSSTLVAIATLSVIALAASIRATRSERSAAAFVQLVGAALLIIVVLAHLAEGLNALPGMGWGRPDSAGHYLDLVSAVGGSILFSAGWLLRRARKR